jgi:hypothetical protein
MDLTTLDTGPLSESGVEIELRHPKTGAPLGSFLTVLGADSTAYRQAERRLLIATAKSGPVSELDAVTVEAAEAQLLANGTVGWRDLEIDGSAYAFNAENARRLYTRFPWIAEQVRRAIHDRGLFLPGSAKP